ncbi:hypothetical protein K1719_047575 [Acacia pycnantha]|nr:hypothetical protein K1719_047575 [Acacia pycnantha]
MLECFSFGSLTSSSASVPARNPPVPCEGYSTAPTPVTSTQSSPRPRYSQRKILEKVLQPDRDSVQEALSLPKPNSLTRLVSTYFDHSETASELCLLLHRSLHCARRMYTPLLDLLSVLPTDFNHITQSHLAQITPSPWCYCYQWFCTFFIATAVGVVISAVVVTTHALAAIAATTSVCPAYISPHWNPKKKELARLAQLEAASKGTYTLNNDLDTIDRLVARLHGAVEADKQSVRLGLEMGKNTFAMQEVIKHLRRDSQNFLLLMEELETRIYICLNFVNKTRWNLLREICLHQIA